MAEKPTFRERLREIIFEADTPKGRNFDIAILWLIGISVILVMLESVEGINEKYGHVFTVLEWIITILFSIEYILRIWTAKNPWKYITSFYGIIDLISTLPMYLSLFVGSNYKFLIVLRVLRLLRVFKVLNMQEFNTASRSLTRALEKSKDRIIVFVMTVLFISLIQGSIMYIVEGPENGFTSIPRGIYWSIVTLTTVGYGDIAPQTSLGRFIATTTMIIGYGILAVGLVTDNSSSPEDKRTNTQVCHNCLKEDHRDGAEYCYNCGHSLEG